MARRRYYRRSARIYPKKKWASNIVQSTVSTSGVGEIVKNSVQSTSVSPTPVILKTGNFKVQGDVLYQASNVPSSSAINLVFFLVFVPEGVTASDSLIGNHPEWIMGWRTIDIDILRSNNPGIAGGSSFSLSTRLKRNLNSGDRVVAILRSGNSALTAECTFTCQFWTCAN